MDLDGESCSIVICRIDRDLWTCQPLGSRAVDSGRDFIRFPMQIEIQTEIQIQTQIQIQIWTETYGRVNP